MFVRPATLDDVEKIVQIHVTTWKISYRGYIKDSILDSSHFDVSEKRIEKMKIPVEKGLVYVAEEEGQIRGFIGLADFDKTNAEIKVFYVDPFEQRKGCGQLLFLYVKDYLKSQGVQHINLFTLENYPISNQFYQKQGLKLTGTRQYIEWFEEMVHEYEMNL